MNAFSLIIEPDEEDPEAAEVLVDGTVGDRAYRFLLDTGAAKSSVIFDTYSATFDAVEQNESSGVFASKSEDLILVPGIEVGPIARQNVIIARGAREATMKRSLIGMDLLKDFSCHFLFDENRVLVDDNSDAQADLAFQELLFDRKFHPYVTVDVAGVNAKAVWDTGAGMTVVNTDFINEHPALFEESGTSTGTDATGHQMETPMFTMDTSIIGDTTFPPCKVAGVDLSRVNATIDIPMNLILGYNVLSKANWLFDFPRRKWAVTKRPGAN